MARIETERDQQARALAEAEERLTEWRRTLTPLSIITRSCATRSLAGCRRAPSIHDLNAALRTVLEAVWLHTVQDPELGHVLIAQFVLRRDEQAGRPPNAALATRVEHWRRLLDDGKPIMPSESDTGTTVAHAAPVPDAIPSHNVRNGRGIDLPPLRIPLTEPNGPP
jgi:hypothetical protein